MPNTSFEAPDELLTDLDHYIADADDIQNRSEAIRAAIRELID